MTTNRPLSIVNRLSLSATSGILLVMSFPGFNYWMLAWVAFVPAFFAIYGERPVKAFLISYIAGVIFFLGALYWLIHVTLPGMIVVVLYLAVYFGLFGLFISYINHKSQITDRRLLFFIPSGWIILEWIRSHLFTGFGWILLGHSQASNLPVIQIADYFGVYGVSFLIMTVNTAIFITLKMHKDRKVDTTVVAIALFLVFIALSYGIIRMKNIFTGEKIRIAVIQGNIPQERKWDSRFREEIIRRYETLTLASLKEKPDLIIWPESSVPGFLEDEKDLLDAVSGLAKKAGVPLLVGTVREEGRSDYYNSAELISPAGEVSGRYDKLHLVPFGEYIPFKRALSFVEKFAPVPIGDCKPGNDYTILNFMVRKTTSGDGVNWKLTKKIKFAVLICFEDIFPELSREFIKRGANFLVNITNDAWYKETSAPFQHAQNSVFRAVENRTNVIRAANTGLSCFIDQRGQIYDMVEKDRKIFTSGFRVQEITLNRAKTFYTIYGDIFVYLCIIAIIPFLMIRRASK